MAKIRKIRIVAVPPGQAPEWVRREWVGLELPIAKNTPDPVDSIETGINFYRPEELVQTAMTKGKPREVIQKRANLDKFKPKNIGGYSVETKTAIAILAEKSPTAAKWWKENISLVLMPWLVFKKEVCELI